MHRDYSFLEEVHTCPHCRTAMECCEAPQFHVGDGLGWGSDILFICLNDDCPLFVNGWAKIEQQYGHSASYRYMELPGSREKNLMMVGNKMAFKGAIVDPDILQRQNLRYQKEQEAITALGNCVNEHDLSPAMTLILDEGADKSQRKRAIQLLLELNDLACIDPIRNHRFRDTSLEQEANMVISQILKNNYLKECPFCCELIKAQARKCQHCKTTL
ncbi:MAG: zinc ribbon domain-containing protein [Desulfopila sp.]